MGRFLFVSWDGGGNVPPSLALGQKLAKRGHQVSFLASRSLRVSVEAAGLKFHGFHEMPEWGSHLQRQFENEEYLDDLWFGPAVGRDLAAQLEAEPADVLVVDFALTSALAVAERSRLPSAALVHVLYHVNLPGGPFTEMWDAALPEINEIRRTLGLAPLDAGARPWDAATVVLALTPKEFDLPVKTLAPNVHFVGPVLADVGATSVKLPWPSDQRGPQVLVSFSTTYQGQEKTLQRVIDAIADLPVHAVVTAGPAVVTDDFRVPANVRIRQYIDHQVVLPSAAAVVTHAGLSTVMAALTYGVPLLCMPMGRDQGSNAARVVAWNAGRMIDPEANSQEIRAALLDVLDSPAYRRAAKRMQKIIRQTGNGSRAVVLLEALLPGTKAPSS